MYTHTLANTYPYAEISFFLNTSHPSLRIRYDAKRTPPAPLDTKTINLISHLNKMYFPLPVPRPAFW